MREPAGGDEGERQGEECELVGEDGVGMNHDKCEGDGGGPGEEVGGLGAPVALEPAFVDKALPEFPEGARQRRHIGDAAWRGRQLGFGQAGHHAPREVAVESVHNLRKGDEMSEPRLVCRGGIKYFMHEKAVYGFFSSAEPVRLPRNPRKV